MERILLLGGTREARIIAAKLAKRDDCEAILSLAGVTSSPPDTGLKQRIGGFGGAMKMAGWMKAEAITTVIDATHPYAAGISANAAQAATAAGVRRLTLWRPGWVAEPADHWQEFPSWQALIETVPDAARVMLTAGQDGISAFAGIERFAVVARALENPAADSGITFINSLPQSDWEAEAALLTSHGITHLVAKNSGGVSSQAKLIAARALNLPVLMLARPDPPPGPRFDDVSSLMDAL